MSWALSTQIGIPRPSSQDVPSHRHHTHTHAPRSPPPFFSSTLKRWSVFLARDATAGRRRGEGPDRTPLRPLHPPVRTPRKRYSSRQRGSVLLTSLQATACVRAAPLIIIINIGFLRVTPACCGVAWCSVLNVGSITRRRRQEVVASGKGAQAVGGRHAVPQSHFFTSRHHTTLGGTAGVRPTEQQPEVAVSGFALSRRAAERTPPLMSRSSSPPPTTAMADQARLPHHL